MSAPARSRAPRVLLVDVPFAHLGRAPLATALLKAALDRGGMVCDVVSLSVAFAAILGGEEYRRFTLDVPPQTLAGDWAFAEEAFGTAAPEASGFVTDVLRGEFRLHDGLVDVVRRARAHAQGFLRKALGMADWGSYDVIGFSAALGQNTAALALARAVKRRHRRPLIVMGGPAWHAVMGVRQLREYDFVDAACLGEGDEALPEFCRRLAAGEDLGGSGLLPRSRAGVRRRGSGSAPVVRDLDGLPAPDFGDYYHALALWGFAETRVELPVETSRGCWWAARSPCTFCGLNGPVRRYRTRSPERVLHELRELDRRWSPSLVDVVDNIVPPSFLRVVLRELAAEPLSAPVFFEARPDLTRDEVRMAARAHASLQLGIESLSQHVLDLMGKGTSAAQNLLVLEWCRDEGVPVTWNLLYGVPGERAADYRQLRRRMPALRRLPPPQGRGPIELQRFSRYFARPAAFGITRVRPALAYRYVYPLPARALRDVAYLFDYDFAPGAGPDDAARAEIAELGREVDAWCEAWSAGRQVKATPA